MNWDISDEAYICASIMLHVGLFDFVEKSVMVF